MRIEVIIPALNEERSIERVIQAIPTDIVERVIAVDNGSTDATAERARNAGAVVISEPERGYGSACLRGVEEARRADILVFLDADSSDDPRELPLLVDPIQNEEAEFVVGSRVRGNRELGAMPIHALFGNRLACFLIWILFGKRFTDLGPFRAIRRDTFDRLAMQDRTYGWTVEMQAKVAILGISSCEIPVSYRKRVGRSKISGTVWGSVNAGLMILWTIFKLWLQRNRIRYR